MRAGRSLFVAVSLAALAATCVTAASARRARLARIDHVVVVVFENRERSSVIGSSDAPTFNRDANQYAMLADYTAIAHPSLPNYLALVAGSTEGVHDDCTSCGPWPNSIGGLLSRAGRSWGAYAQGYPSSPRFAKKHMPFLYFSDGISHVHPLSGLDSRRLPSFAFVAPDLCNDGHDCPLTVADAFLAHWIAPLLRVPRTAIFVLFDEGTTSKGGGGEVAGFVAGTAVKSHVVVHRHVSHYTVLRTVEDIFGLRHLGASKDETPLTGIWR